MIDVLPGLLITFFFLALTSACKPFCTEGLSRLHALTLVAQLVSLYSGLVLIVEDNISVQFSAANESDNTSGKTSILYALIYLFNGAVVGWPAIQFLLLNSPLEIVEIIRAKIKMLASGNLKVIVGDDDDGSDGDGDGSDDSNVGFDGGDGGIDSRKEHLDQLECAVPATRPAGTGAVPAALHEVTPAVDGAVGMFWTFGTQNGGAVGEQATGGMCAFTVASLCTVSGLPPYRAAEKGHAEAVGALVAAGAVVDAQDVSCVV